MGRRGLICGAEVVLLLLTWNGVFAGTITGTITVKGAKDARDIVVYIDTIPGKAFPAPANHVTINQQNLKFIPRVLPVLVGTTVDFLNSDAVLHNVFTPDKVADRFNLGSYPKGRMKSHTFDKLGAAVMLCNVHPEMEAYVVVLPTSYYAVTGGDGRYRIEKVPAGTYTLKVWYERGKSHPPQTVTVSETGEVTANFEMERR